MSSVIDNILIREHEIDKKTRSISGILFGKDKDIIFSNSKTDEFINELNKNGTLKVLEDHTKIIVTFENKDWFEGTKSVVVLRFHYGKKAKAKRLAVTTLCSLIVNDYKSKQ